MAESHQDTVNRLPKLNEPPDYIQWKRRVHAFLRRDDPHLIGLSRHPQGSAVFNENWLKKSTKAKSNIILSLGDNALAQTRLIVDSDDKTAREYGWNLKEFIKQRMNSPSKTSVTSWIHSFSRMGMIGISM